MAAITPGSLGAPLGPSDADVNARRVVHEGLAARLWQPGRGDQVVIAGQDLGTVQRPRLVPGPCGPVPGAG